MRSRLPVKLSYLPGFHRSLDPGKSLLFRLNSSMQKIPENQPRFRE
ncbi:hypothetical protein [Flavihumibacter sp.]